MLDLPVLAIVLPVLVLSSTVYNSNQHAFNLTIKRKCTYFCLRWCIYP